MEVKATKSLAPGQHGPLRVLLCTFSFPPLGDPTSYRWFQFAAHLGKEWQLDVLTIRVATGYPGYDHSPLDRLPGWVNVYRTYPGLYAWAKGRPASGEQSLKVRQGSTHHSIWQGSGLKKRLRQLVVPDRQIEWLPFALLKAWQLVRKNCYDLVVSSSFPFTSHIVGWFAKRWAGTPWIGDISDPYAFMPEFGFPRWRQQVDQRVESSLLKGMSSIVVPTREMKAAYLSWYPHLCPEKITVIPYGFDADLVESIQPELSAKFRIVYTGIFYDKIRSPYPLFDAMKGVRDLPVELVIAGEMPAEYVNYVGSLGLTGQIIFLGPQPRARAIALQKGATILLLLGNKGGLQLPGKVFEYIAANRPILHIRNDTHDIAADLVQRLGRGLVVENEPALIAEAVRHLYHSWQDGQSFDRQYCLSNRDDFSWRSQAARFAALMRGVLEQGEACS